MVKIHVLALVFAVSGCVTDELSSYGTGESAGGTSGVGAAAPSTAPQGGSSVVGSGGSQQGGAGLGGAATALSTASGGQGSGGAPTSSGGAGFGGASLGGAHSGGTASAGGSYSTDCPGSPAFTHQVCAYDSAGTLICHAATCLDAKGAGYCSVNSCLECPNTKTGYSYLNCDGNSANECETYVGNLTDPLTGRPPSTCQDYRRVIGLPPELASPN